MAAVRAFMLSMLAVRRYGDQEAFSKAYPHPWLIWEPGTWQPAQPGSEPSQTLTGASGDFRPQSTGDALCFELGQRHALKVGRSRSCDIQVNDATISREHLVLEPEPFGSSWLATPITSSNTTGLNGLSLPGQSLPLRAGDQLRLGQVLFTFADPAAMLGRLEEHLRKATQPLK